MLNGTEKNENTNFLKSKVEKRNYIILILYKKTKKKKNSNVLLKIVDLFCFLSIVKIIFCPLLLRFVEY